MGHVFISYKSDDKYQLEALVKILDELNIAKWVDNEIEAGLKWREEIDNALVEAFAIAVILTDKSVESHYITYEWAWALGHGIPVIPLVFQPEVPTKIHPRLAAVEYMSCYPSIPKDRLSDILLHYQKVSPLTRYIEGSLGNYLIPLRILLRSLVALCSGPFKYRDGVGRAKGEIALEVGVEIMALRSRILPQFWLSSAHAFAPKQKKHFEKLDELLDVFFTKYLNRLVHVYMTEELTSGSIENCEKETFEFWQRELEPHFQSLYYFTELYHDYDSAIKIASKNFRAGRLLQMNYIYLHKYELETLLGNERFKSLTGVWETLFDFETADLDEVEYPISGDQSET